MIQIDMIGIIGIDIIFEEIEIIEIQRQNGILDDSIKILYIKIERNTMINDEILIDTTNSDSIMDEFIEIHIQNGIIIDLMLIEFINILKQKQIIDDLHNIDII
jgi:hypothetical protein